MVKIYEIENDRKVAITQYILDEGDINTKINIRRVSRFSNSVLGYFTTQIRLETKIFIL